MEKEKNRKKAIVIICMNICLIGLLFMTIFVSTSTREHVSVIKNENFFVLGNEDQVTFLFDTKENSIVGLDIVCYQIKYPILQGYLVCNLYTKEGKKIESYKVPVVNISVRQEELTIEFNKEIKGKYSAEIYLEGVSQDDAIGLCVDNEAEQQFHLNGSKCNGMISYGFVVESNKHPYIVHALFLCVLVNMLVASLWEKKTHE